MEVREATLQFMVTFVGEDPFSSRLPCAFTLAEDRYFLLNMPLADDVCS